MASIIVLGLFCVACICIMAKLDKKKLKWCIPYVCICYVLWLLFMLGSNAVI